MRPRELLLWPWRHWLRAAQKAGEIVLAGAAVAVLPPLDHTLRAVRAAVRSGERVLTPARALAVVAFAATITLGASQFSDYRTVEIGSAQYTGVEDVAPAPETGRESPRAAHGLAVLGIAIAALLVTAFAVGGRWRLARLLVVLGGAVIVISLLVDAREGLREGLAATIYEGAHATLLGGFWAQLVSGITLAVCGPLLALHLGRERAARHTRTARRRGGRGVRPSTLEASAAGSGAEGAAT